MALAERYSHPSAIQPISTIPCYDATPLLYPQQTDDRPPCYSPYLTITPSNFRVPESTVPCYSRMQEVQPPKTGDTPTYYDTASLDKPEETAASTDQGNRGIWYPKVPSIQTCQEQRYSPYHLPPQEPPTHHFSHPEHTSCPAPAMPLPQLFTDALTGNQPLTRNRASYYGYPICYPRIFPGFCSDQNNNSFSTRAPLPSPAGFNNCSILSLPSISWNSIHTADVLTEEIGYRVPSSHHDESDPLNLSYASSGHFNVLCADIGVHPFNYSQKVAEKSIPMSGLVSQVPQSSTSNDLSSCKQASLKNSCNVIQTPKGDIYQCKTCSLMFTTTATYNKHCRKCGTTKRIYSCNICSKLFNDKKVMVVHRRIHTGEKPFQCAYCMQTFSDNSCKTKHERTHTKERPYQCEECGFRFTQSGNLKRHKRNVHKVTM